jgi:hypothetical protein
MFENLNCYNYPEGDSTLFATEKKALLYTAFSKLVLERLGKLM